MSLPWVKKPAVNVDKSIGLKCWGLIKFNAFNDTGGEQSFALCLLDESKNGIVLTSLHGRDATRFYVKEISDGKSDQELSAEEKKAINKALS